MLNFDLSNKNMKNFLYKTGISLLIILWIYAAGSKLLEYNSFKHQLSMQHFPFNIEDTMAWLLPSIEILIAGLLIATNTIKYGLIASAFLLIIFTIYITLIITGIYDKAPCSCGGVLSMLSWESHLLFNISFLSINAWTIYTFYQNRKEAEENK
jgi:putative oxidoreductase